MCRTLFTLLFSLVAAVHTVIPTQAEAASALFRVKQSWSGLTNNGTTFGPVTYTSPDYHPRMFGSGKAPPASGYVADGTGTVFTIPSKVIKSYGTKTCFPLGCNPPVTYSAVFNSYWNARGVFQPNFGPSSTQTIRFDTTMGNPWPPPWTGEPVSPTTLFSGNYDFSRSGTIRIIPGVNRFGGTLRMLAGANHMNFRTYTGHNLLARQYGAGTRLIAADWTTGWTTMHAIPTAYRFKMTGDYYKQKIVFSTTRLDTGWPWSKAAFTTGTVVCSAHITTLSHSKTLHDSGYDNRTAMGLYGIISLVRPRLVHSYVVPHDPNLPIRKERTFARIDRVTIHFLPEPGSMAMLAAGLMALMSLSVFRRD
jgi:hypothetical protein